MEGKYAAGIVTIVVTIMLVGSVLVPIIDVSGGSWDETITTTYNEDPDLQFDKQTSNFALDMSVTIGDEITIINATDTVTAPYGSMFLLAADNSAVFINASDDLIFTWSDDSGKHSLTLQGDFTAAIADGKLTINDGTVHDAPLPAAYLYVPSSTGQYGSFASGELNKRASDPVIAAGSFAGAVAYNSSVTLVGDAMVIDVDGTDTLINSVEWVPAPAADPAVVTFDPSTITIQPLDPSVLDDPAVLMTVPTPTYTDGDWGYDLITSGYDTTVAKIVSYSGAGGGAITIPATVGGYDVKEVGIGESGSTVFDTSISATDLVISDGIVKINYSTFNNCRGFTGSLIIPDSVTSIGSNAFNNCSGLTSLILSMEQGTTIGSTSFRNTTNLKEVLNLGTLELTTTSYELNADVIQDYIGADCYIAPATIIEVIHHSNGGGEMGAMYAAIPVVIITAILLAAVSMFVIRRGM